MSKDQSFAEYLANESDYIEIFMQSVASQIENLPNPIAYCKTQPLKVMD